MFTGIIETAGTIAGFQRGGGRGAGALRLAVRAETIADQCRPGASVAVDGVCLSVTEAGSGRLCFDVIKETLDRSALGEKAIGDRVNLERSLRVGDRLDGHFVQGHVDGTATVDRVVVLGAEWVVWFRPQDHLVPYIIPKGSVAIDGVSLTIADVEPQRFSVALIPTTLEQTTLGAMKPGGRVNVETDLIARTIIHQLSCLRKETSLTLETLKEAGFA